jgi:hypothetical protein
MTSKAPSYLPTAGYLSNLSALQAAVVAVWGKRVTERRVHMNGNLSVKLTADTPPALMGDLAIELDNRLVVVFPLAWIEENSGNYLAAIQAMQAEKEL